MNSVERVTGRLHSESDTPRRTAGSTVLPAEFLLRLLALILPFAVEILRRYEKKRDECPNGGHSEQQNHNEHGSGSTSYSAPDV